MDYLDSKGDLLDLLFTRYLSSKTENRIYLELYVLFKQDLFILMSVFAGRTIRFPSLPVLQKLQRDIEIHHDACTMPMDEVCAKYELRKNTVTAIKNRIDRQFQKFDILKEKIDDERFTETYGTYKRNSTRSKLGSCSNGQGRASNQKRNRRGNGQTKLASVKDISKQSATIRAYATLLDFIREESV